MITLFTSDQFILIPTIGFCERRKNLHHLRLAYVRAFYDNNRNKGEIKSFFSVCRGRYQGEITQAVKTSGDIKRKEIMEINKIYNEDCLETLKRMEDNSIDLVVTSPPYNKGWYGDWKADKNSAWSVGGIKYDTYEDAMPPEKYEKWQREIISECMRVLKPSGSLYYNHKDIIFKGLIVHPKWVYDYNVREVILWDRGGSPQISNQFFMPVTEYIWWIVKDPKQVHF